MKVILKNSALGCIHLCLFYFFPMVLNAQKTNSAIRKFYFQTGGGPASFSGSNGDIALKAVMKNKWSATVSYTSLDMKPKNQPSDYVPETGVALFLIPYSNEIRTQMNLISFTAGKYFPISKKCWVTTEAGLSYVSGDKVTYQRASSQSSDPLLILFGTQYTTSNYTTSIEKINTVGGMIRADFNWAFSSFMGLGAGVFANFNSIQSPVGAQLTLTMGWMGTERKAKKRNS